MGKLDGKVAFITGAARGQGRAHAIKLASEGASIIAVDICSQIASVEYAMATPEDLDLTVKEVDALGRSITAHRADVRDRDALQAAYDAGVEALGPVDIVVANASIATLTPESGEAGWTDVLDVNLTGVYHTIEVARPSLVARGVGGSIVLTSSVAGLTGMVMNSPGGLAYTAAKHALVGLMRSYANMLAPHNIRVNTIHPGGVATPMLVNPVTEALFTNGAPEGMSDTGHALPVVLMEAEDMANAVAWLVSEDARYVTGVALPIDAGFTNRR
ncbi:mycofactocin-coupled SDR family oxidoreductase [Mycobacterium sp. NPDC050853]|uniref:mycofactocin-coupled SDR family oxidoreductase n=1 Tax=Mycobacterium sp. NPDC050853 TaxID=3155160 RepID=UPI0033C83D53